MGKYTKWRIMCCNHTFTYNFITGTHSSTHQGSNEFSSSAKELLQLPQHISESHSVRPIAAAAADDDNYRTTVLRGPQN